MGRAAAIAYAREGADIAINYLAAEEPDAREVSNSSKRKGVFASQFLAIFGTRRFASDWYPKQFKAWVGSTLS